MSDIDPEKLEEDLKEAERAGFAVHPSLIFTAARAWLAQQPRFKEVEVEQWATATQSGAIMHLYTSEEAAREAADCETYLSLVAVRLTGTAKVRA